jgi:hypothetical protein
MAASDMTAPARSFLRIFCGLALGLTLALSLAIWLVDPYGVSPIRLPITRPIMDINQRYMYPQIVRSRDYDSVLIGTSTSRLLEPHDLSAAFGGRFANLAMNAATAWEQTELAKLYLRHQPAPKAFIVGLDHMWCQPEGQITRITFRGFPEWMYDENRWNDLAELLNTKTLEIAGRLLAFHLGLMPERIRRDGYEVFTPPESTYDLARARWHIWKDVPEGRIVPVTPPRTLSAADAAALKFPALVWLDELLGQLPSETFRMLAVMPLHVAAQPRPGSHAAAVGAICLERIGAIARKHRAPFVDFAIPSSVTTDDANYWDPLHYRLPIARRIIAGMKAAAETGADAPDGLYKVR